jgi:hypothetical protein
MKRTFMTIVRATVLAALAALCAGGSLHITRSPVTGLVTFLQTDPRRPVPAPMLAVATRTDKARAFIDTYREALGVRAASQLRVVKSHGPDEVGIERVRFQHQHNGVPVRGGELTVHLRGSEVVTVNAKTVPDLDQVDTTPHIDATVALAAAREVLAQDLQVTDAQFTTPALELFNLGSRAVSPLAVGASSVGTITLQMPAGTVARRYFLLAVADGENVVTETIENNNIKSIPITVP